MWPIPWLNMGMLVVQVVLTTLVFLAGGGVAGALVVNTLTSTGQLIVAYGMYQRWFVVKQPRAAAIRQPSLADYTRALLKRAWPFALAAILAALQARLGIILLEQLSDTHEVGLYAAASRFVEAGRMIPNAIFGALLPALVSLTARPAAVDRLFSRATLGLSVLSGTTGLVLILLATPLLITTFGEDFQPATPVLQIGALALLPALLRGLRTLYWYALGQEQFVNRVTAGTLILQIILMFQLIPQFGALGVVIATLIVESVGLILLWFSVGTRSKSRDRTETT
jgi:O-antigen/teichoic acid export membrane protein